MSNWFKTTSIYWFKKPTAISTPTKKKKKKKKKKKGKRNKVREKEHAFFGKTAIPKGLALSFSFICLMGKGSVYIFFLLWFLSNVL